MDFMPDTLPGLIVERAIPSDVWGRSYDGKIQTAWRRGKISCRKASICKTLLRHVLRNNSRKDYTFCLTSDN